MKGSIACLIASSQKYNPKRNVYFIFSGSEEDNSQGTKNLLSKIKIPKSQIIIPEPTNEIIYTKHGGYLEYISDEENIQKRFNPEEKKAFYDEQILVGRLNKKIIYSNPLFVSIENKLIKKIKLIDAVKVSENSFKGWTEAGIFNKYGEVIIFGAGDYSVCHKPNENISLENLNYFTELFSRIINYKN